MLPTGYCKQTWGLICLQFTTTCCIFSSASSVPAVIHFSLNTNTDQYGPHTKNSCKNQTGAKDKLPSHLPQVMLGEGRPFSYSKGFAALREVEVGPKYCSERADALQVPILISRHIRNTVRGWANTDRRYWSLDKNVPLCIKDYKYWGRTDQDHFLQHDPELRFLAINLGTLQGQVTQHWITGTTICHRASLCLL